MANGATHVIIMGPQGAGKGTQAAVVAPKLDLAHVSTGDLFRQAMAGDSELGQEVRSYVDRGALVPDELTIQMLTSHIDKLLREQAELRGVLLDGFPRNAAQAAALDRALAERGDRLAAVVHIDVPREALIERLAGRLVCSQCGATYHTTFNPPKQPGVCDVCGGALVQRSDDTPEAVTRRLAIYDEQTAPVLEHYRQGGLLVGIAGDRPIEAVSESILAALRPRMDVA